MTDLPAVQEVRVLRLQPGDVIVARLAEGATAHGMEGVARALREQFPDHKVIVTAGLTLELARNNPTSY